MIDRRALVDRGIVPGLLALVAQLLFGAVAIQPALATVQASPLCVHATHGDHHHGTPPAQSISPLLTALAVPAPTHVPPPALPMPHVVFTSAGTVISPDAAPHERTPQPYRARGPPVLA